MNQVIGVTRSEQIFNSATGWLARHGIGLAGARELTTTGRRSGLPRRTPVNPFECDGQTYLFAPRGETDWVRNVRVNPQVSLQVGRRRTEHVATEVTDPAVRADAAGVYLRKWAWEVRRFFPEVDKHATDDELLAVARTRPVFRLDAPRWAVG